MKPLEGKESMLSSLARQDLTRSACSSVLCGCPEAISAVLGHKYAALRQWRLHHEALSQDATPMQAPGAHQALQAALRALAAIYPGVLRELERLDGPELALRQAQAQRAPGCAPLWLRLVWDYHTLWHRGLAYRRFCHVQNVHPRAPGPQRQALVTDFACWYERAARDTPWATQKLPALWLDPEQGAASTRGPGPKGLGRAVWSLLQRRYALDAASVSQALWGPQNQDVASIREASCAKESDSL